MTSNLRAVGSTDSDIERLKLQLVSEDTKGHSCQHCSVFKIKFRKLTDGRLRSTSYLDTTEREVHRKAGLGFSFWSMISDRLALIRLRQKAKSILGKVPDDLCFSTDNLSESYDCNLAEALEGEDRNDFYRLDHAREMYWNDAFRTDNDGLDLGSSLTRQPQGNNVPKDLLRLTFSSGMIYFCLYLTFRLLKEAPFLTLIPPRKKFEIDSKHMAVGSPMNLEPSSTTTVDLIQCWLQKCEFQHRCGLFDLPSSMPSMLLQVSSRDSAVLVEVAPQMRMRYLALSYCWGQGTQRLLLFRNNKSTLTSSTGIKISQLDATVRDAIITTYELGFEYLWIDALCIIQDDEDFKAKELQKMGDIYRNAAFTIVPSAAGDVREGFLKRRFSTLERVVPARGRPQIVFKIVAEWKDDRSNEMTQFSAILRTSDLTANQEPWYNRAWTLREALFSRRRLQYHEKQTTWRCYCTGEKVLEDDGRLSRGDEAGGLTSSEVLGHVTRMLWGRQNLPHTSVVFGYWYSLVSTYSRRKLTYFTDRLPAISSTAREFASILQDQYVRGLWVSDLALGLAWRAGTTGLSYDYNLPSWNWASYIGAASWQRGECKQSQDFQVLRFSGLPVDPFREAGSTEIHIRGLLMPFLYNFHLHNDESVEWDDDDSKNPEITVTTDYYEDCRFGGSSETKIHLLALIVTCRKALP
ncbi:tol protein [Colletotrichum kahawae]|uniref:Tol protein n=1 Tax=Colletotrichum kahawae TaxID=34407 RepID=A0AAE0D0I1_COLKA|nr:tol protein [Colletotrichum kahawae]